MHKIEELKNKGTQRKQGLKGKKNKETPADGDFGETKEVTEITVLCFHVLLGLKALLG